MSEDLNRVVIDALVVDGVLFLFCRGRREIELAVRLILETIGQSNAEHLGEELGWSYWERGKVRRDIMYPVVEVEEVERFCEEAAARLAMFTGEFVIGAANSDATLELTSSPMDGWLSIGLGAVKFRDFVGIMVARARIIEHETKAVFSGDLAPLSAGNG
jgi:hypothetical protein